MNWEKQGRFENRRRNGTDAANLWKYVPKKLKDAIDDVWVDPDGYWVYLNEGYTAYDHGSDCGTIHECTIADLREAFKTVQKG